MMLCHGCLGFLQKPTVQACILSYTGLRQYTSLHCGLLRKPQDPMCYAMLLPQVNYCKICLKTAGLSLYEVFDWCCVVFRHFTIEKMPQLCWSVYGRNNWAAPPRTGAMQ